MDETIPRWANAAAGSNPFLDAAAIATTQFDLPNISRWKGIHRECSVNRPTEVSKPAALWSRLNGYLSPGSNGATPTWKAS
jgi:hypothetical protein